MLKNRKLIRKFEIVSELKINSEESAFLLSFKEIPCR